MRSIAGGLWPDVGHGVANGRGALLAGAGEGGAYVGWEEIYEDIT
jgi:hypothetical protein